MFCDCFCKVSLQLAIAEILFFLPSSLFSSSLPSDLFLRDEAELLWALASSPSSTLLAAQFEPLEAENGPCICRGGIVVREAAGGVGEWLCSCGSGERGVLYGAQWR